MTDHLQLVPGVIGRVGDGASVRGDIPSEIPTPPAKLSAREKKVWGHVTTALHEVGLIHRTDALALTVIVRTFVRWLDAEEQLNAFIDGNDGSYIVTTPNGYQQPHQLFHLAGRLRGDLLKWLPEAALTIPSFAKAVESRSQPQQGTLFDDPVEAHRARRAAMGVRGV